jgi:hypothetical protein
MFNDDTVLRALHPSWGVEEIGWQTPERHEKPGTLRQTVIPRSLPPADRTLAALRPVVLDRDLNAGLLAAGAKFDRIVNKTGETLNPVQNGLNFELNSWSPGRRLPLVRNNLLEPARISYFSALLPEHAHLHLQLLTQRAWRRACGQGGAQQGTGARGEQYLDGTPGAIQSTRGSCVCLPSLYPQILLQSQNFFGSLQFRPQLRSEFSAALWCKSHTRQNTRHTHCAQGKTHQKPQQNTRNARKHTKKFFSCPDALQLAAKPKPPFALEHNFARCYTIVHAIFQRGGAQDRATTRRRRNPLGVSNRTRCAGKDVCGGIERDGGGSCV